jgi:small subunit ribosomal protein S15e
MDIVNGVQIKKKRTFKKFTFRGVDLDQLLTIKSENLVELLDCRARRHFKRGIKRKEENLLKRLRKVNRDKKVVMKIVFIKKNL